MTDILMNAIYQSEAQLALYEREMDKSGDIDFKIAVFHLYDDEQRRYNKLMEALGDAVIYGNQSSGIH